MCRMNLVWFQRRGQSYLFMVVVVAGVVLTLSKKGNNNILRGNTIRLSPTPECTVDVIRTKNDRAENLATAVKCSPHLSPCIVQHCSEVYVTHVHTY